MLSHARPLVLALGAAWVLAGATDCGPGNSCSLNADCKDSQAAKDYAHVKCGSEVYCLAGTCHGECVQICEPVRSDTNPCAGNRLCEPNGVQYGQCTILPIKCSTVADCPSYLPPTEAGPSAWSCTDGVCRNPAWTYATH